MYPVSTEFMEKMKSDRRRVLAKVTIDYFVTNAILKQLKELYQSGIHNNLNLKIEQEDGSIEEYEVVFRPFSRSRYLVGDKWYWEGISIELEEV